MEQDKITLRKLRGVGEILNDTFDFVVKDFKNLFKVLLFIAGPFMAITAVASGIYQANMNQMFLDGDVMRINTPEYFSSLAIMMSIGVVGGLFYFSTLYHYLLVYMKNEGEQVSVSSVWKHVRSNLWMFIKTFLGLLLMMIPIMLVFALLAMLIVAIAGVIAQFLGPVAVIAGMILLYVALFAIMMPLSMIFNIRIYEGQRFFASFSKCYKLLSGNYLKGFVVMFVLVVIQLIFTALITAPALILQFVDFSGFIKENSRAILIIFQFIAFAVQFVLGALLIVGINILYFSLSEQKDAQGLMDKIEEIGSDIEGQ